MHGFIVSTAGTSKAAHFERACAAMQSQGLENALTYTYESVRVEAFRAAHQPLTTAIGISEAGRMLVCLGWLRIGNKAGAAAMRVLIEHVQTMDDFRALALGGQCVVVAAIGNEVCVRTESMGLLHTYYADDAEITTNSWLAAARASEHVQWDEQACLEYVLLGAPHSLRTPIRNVTRWQRASHINLRPQNAPTLALAPRREPPLNTETFDEAVDSFAKRFADNFRLMSRFAPGAIRCELGGDIDSRLLLATALANGVAPELYVRADARPQDLALVNSLAQHVGLETVVAMPTHREGSGATEATKSLEALFQHDGWSPFGLHHTAEQEASLGLLSANGGYALDASGGGTLRDFYVLPNDIGSANTIVNAVYKRIPSAMFRSRDARAKFYEQVRIGVERSVNSSGLFTRATLARCYALHRCQHLVGRCISVSSLRGSTIAPLLDPSVFEASTLLPRAWKDGGRFQAAVIRSLCPSLAEVPCSDAWIFDAPMPRMARYALLARTLQPVSTRGLASRWRWRATATSIPFEITNAHPLHDMLNLKLLNGDGNEPHALMRFCALQALATVLDGNSST
jgi:hypothetical protein